MRKSLIAGCLASLFTGSFSFGQELYVPRDVKKAYENETRSESGKPGKNYWQNSAKYKIDLQVNPPSRTVKGSEEIIYTNNSPNTLNSLNFKLILNNHKPGAARLGQASEDYMTNGIEIDSYSENGTKKEWNSKNDGTNKMIKLDTPLQPGEKINLSIDWHFDVSKQSGREGAILENTFFLAYFYPRVAVYDDYMGWDTMTFFGMQEFYNDFNDYEISVNVPEGFIVWSTGDLLNAEEVLQKKYAKKLEKSMESDEVIRIATPEDLKKKEITKDGNNTWKWKASNITDIAIAISNEYNWDAASVVVDSTSNRRVSVQAAYDNVSEDFHQMVNYGQHALNWFSHHYPGIAYPYSKSTLVRGHGDMEYPMMVNDNSHGEPELARFVAEHEIAHTYFPFYMGTNETRFGFMDEGWATTLEHLIGIEDIGEENAIESFKNFRVQRWINDDNMEQDVPIITPSNILSGPVYRNNSYGKAALGYLALKDILGDELFKKALQGYMDRWNGKHPIPWDFFYSINDISGKDLNWFWDNWYFKPNHIDFEIKKVTQNDNSVEVLVFNIGGMPAPFDVKLTFADGSSKSIHQKSTIWENAEDEFSIQIETDKQVEAVTLEGGIWMDATPENNTWKK
ncbi:M1 family metallopeptidase [Zunongwangia sp. SCSIO 43204]|uniref:M1 family metallopeptidase n=1 Tax=Zunongwangia sp. SCSIO 43204 TaxID=2779359 RepID=UPI001CA7CEAF|nr:M1 family metallopeptidase [Zunongwangia sp. SCSIO 43204]UAB83394.1 M1 family metallopeptidase [Zunongwangia sp. SCSIO 43204]